MESTTKQTLAIGAVIFFIFLVTAGIIMRRSRNYLPARAPAKKTEKNEPQSREAVQREREKILATDPADPSHVNNITYIKEGLKKYYAEKKAYPKKLSELVPRYLYIAPRYSSDVEYLYAYFPAEKPSAYHLGAPLGGRNINSPGALSSDADFHSEKAKYVNGFNGADPVYDVTGEKGK